MKQPILILHGWMVKPSRYHAIEDIFKRDGYRVYIPDMPGFGKVELPKDPMTVDDYVNWVVGYLKKNAVKKVTIIGHSFGGRVGAKLALRYPEVVNCLILTGAPLIKQPLTFKKQILLALAKRGKTIMESFPKPIGQVSRKVLYRLIGEYDYYKAGSMQQTFICVNNEDLSSILPEITVPTLVIWGENDTFVSLSVGKAIAGKIPHATLTVIRESGHGLPYENPPAFTQSVLGFLE